MLDEENDPGSDSEEGDEADEDSNGELNSPLVINISVKRVTLQTRTFIGMNTQKTKMHRPATNVLATMQAEHIDTGTNLTRTEMALMMMTKMRKIFARARLPRQARGPVSWTR